MDWLNESITYKQVLIFAGGWIVGWLFGQLIIRTMEALAMARRVKKELD